MTGPAPPRLEVCADPAGLSHRVADWILDLTIAKDGDFAVALSGGSTPRRLYRLLASPPYCEVFPWCRVHWFWGDERFVPPDDPSSNYRMAREAMLSRAPIPAGHIHAMPTEGLTPDAAAAVYERELMTFYGAGRLDAARPLFDLTLLGLGPDGHTASLFPSMAALDERQRWVVATLDAEGDARLTLTYPTLESSRYVAFLAEGESKHAIVDRLLRGESDFPAARIRPTGILWLFADAKAADG